MDPNRQRIALAEACGWKIVAPMRGFLDGDYAIIPLYLDDLNSTHEAEKCICTDHMVWEIYLEKLREVCLLKRAIFPETAPADARVEALLKTISRWEETT